MKLLAIALTAACALPITLSLSLPAGADRTRPCQARIVSSDVESEINNCPISTRSFSIRGTFASSNLRASFWAWEPGYYILNIENRQTGRVVNIGDFNVSGTTDRPQYRFTDAATNLTYVVTFRYSDPNTIRLEIFQNNRAIANELLPRESNQLIGGP